MRELSIMVVSMLMLSIVLFVSPVLDMSSPTGDGGPIADAGPDQTVLEGKVAAFDGSSSVGSYGQISFSKNTRISEYHPLSVSAKFDSQIQVDKNGVVHIIWQEFIYNVSYAVLYYSKSIDGGFNFGPNVQIMNATRLHTILSLNPRFTVNNDGTLYVIWTSWAKGDYHPEIFLTKTENGGNTFDEPRLILEDNVSCGLSIDSTGSFRLLAHGISWNLYHLVSEDGGITFGKSTQVNDPDVIDYSLFDLDASRMSIDSFSNIHVTWPGRRMGEDTKGDIFYSRSEDGGMTFSADLKVNEETGKIYTLAPSMDVDSSGNPHLVWIETPSYEPGEVMKYVRSTDGGRSFQKNIYVRRGGEKLGRGVGFVTGPFLRVGPDDVPRIAWIEYYDSSEDCNVWFSMYDKNRGNFSDRLLVSDHQNNETIEGLVALDVDGTGNSHLAWSDNREGDQEIFYSRTVPGRAKVVSYEWDMNHLEDSNGDGNFTNDADRIGPSPTFVYGDNGIYNVTLRITDELGATDTDTAIVTVENVNPSIHSVTYEMDTLNASILFRVAGEKWHNVEVFVYENDIEIGSANVTRSPESPNEQIIDLVSMPMDLSKEYSAVAYYTPIDDPINGEIWGATPAWFILRFDGEERRVHHTFNVRHEDTWVWNMDNMNQYFPFVVTFEATASDPGSDDLTFVWDFGDGDSASKTYFNNGIGPDPYPSPDIRPMMATDVQRHAFTGQSMYTVTLTVQDDDGGVSHYSFDLMV